MQKQKSKVYAKIDNSNRILSIDGGRTESNIKDFSAWVFIDEGIGTQYEFCQNNYLQKPIQDNRGIYRYKLEDGKAVERTQEEMDAEYAEPEPQPTQDQRIENIEAAISALLDGINA